MLTLESPLLSNHNQVHLWSKRTQNSTLWHFMTKQQLLKATIKFVTFNKMVSGIVTHFCNLRHDLTQPYKSHHISLIVVLDF